ncbi:MAG TPA: phosphatase PAP2 family protein [Anaerolineales bacterium]|nr:phosphatase PAP2 family protein [Anaerolineales bacterium]
MNLTSLLKLDVRLSDGLRVAEKPGALRDAAIFFAHSGDSWFWAAALIVLWGLGNSFWKQWAILELAGISVLAVLVMTLKFVIRRRRPAGEWGGIYRNTDPHSFPSGHSARAFMIALVAAGLGPLWAALILGIWAPLVALARVAMGVHYVSDIVAGFLVGILMGLIVIQFHQPLALWLAAFIHYPLW